MWRITAQATSFYDLVERLDQAPCDRSWRILTPGPGALQKLPPVTEMIDLPGLSVGSGNTTSESDKALTRLSVGCGEPTLP